MTETRTIDAAAAAAEAFAAEMRQRHRPQHEPAVRPLDPGDPGLALRQPSTRRWRADSDTLSASGAHRLAAVIRKFWADAGHDISVTVSPRSVPGTEGAGVIYEIRSSLVGGLPR